MIVDVIACQPGDRLTDILEKQASGTQVGRSDVMSKEKT